MLFVDKINGYVESHHRKTGSSVTIIFCYSSLPGAYQWSKLALAPGDHN